MPTNITIDIGQHEHGFPIVINTEDGPIDGWHSELVWLVTAQSAEGHRWTAAEPFEDEAEAKEWAATHGDPIADPDAWFQNEPCYGSDAWGDDDERTLACFEADAYGEPRPRW